MRWMLNMISRLRLRRLGRDETGQSLIIMALAIVALVGIIGLGVDLGMAYAERVQLSRAMDAAALAAAQELPLEEASHERALEYLTANNYDPDTACVETLGSNVSGGPGSCDDTDEKTLIIIDTLSYRSDAQPNENTANQVNVRARQDVPLSFLRVLGFQSVPVSASATAENIDDLDIVIVYDRSGSMQQDTRCYGCWEKVPGLEYPDGNTFPLPYTEQCDPSDPLDYSGDPYLSIEAEHYSRYAYEADYHYTNTEHPKTWWALQRDRNENASGTDSRGAFMMVGSHGQYAMYYETLGDIVHPPGYWTTPRLDYDFTVPENGTYYVWIRAQGGNRDSSMFWANGRESRRKVHLGLNGAPMATGRTCYWGPYADGASNSVRKNADQPDGNCNTNYEGWSWSRVLALPGLVANDPYTLNVWAGGQGFRLDKIVITKDDRGTLDTGGRPLDWNTSGISDSGPAETHGRTNWACMGPGHPTPDPRYVPVDPATGERDDLYDDYQPIRAAKEAAKTFVRRLNPELDQIGYVWYSNTSEIKEELYCLKQGLGCTNFENVVSTIESTNASGGTNIGDAMWDGIRVLTTGQEPNPDPAGKGVPPKPTDWTYHRQHYGRSNAAHIMVLMTDGQANAVPNEIPSSYGNCYSDDLWPDVPGESTNQRRARECVIWFALKARDQGIVVYTIGLGAQADNELLAHAADLTGGWYYFAPSAADLDEIFDSLYERIFLRLTD